MPLRPAEYDMLAAFRYSLRQFLSFSEQAAGEVGLTPQQYQALLAVRAHRGEPPLTIAGLAREMLVRHHSAVGMVDRLEEQGLVRREPSTDDRRKVGIRLTARGQRVFDRLAAVHRRELRRIGPDLARFMTYFAGSSRKGRVRPS
ncbi:MAG TPA: MarR family transcriptional regulator [Usitatibacter sp.]|jgi:DNA-binding MarR family transcriptional regulator|nr:MarR family transcriptional regulator [Usitatibacter sp.]